MRPLRRGASTCVHKIRYGDQASDNSYYNVLLCFLCSPMLIFLLSCCLPPPLEAPLFSSRTPDSGAHRHLHSRTCMQHALIVKSLLPGRKIVTVSQGCKIDSKCSIFIIILGGTPLGRYPVQPPKSTPKAPLADSRELPTVCT